MKKEQTMKILHTADWHIGKWVNGFSMLEDQMYILNQMLETISKEKPDVVLISGDLYDRSIPPIGAVKLLNDTLRKIIQDLKTPVIAIAGNHDSNERLQFASDLLKSSGLYLIGISYHPFEKITFNDRYGEVDFYPIAYMDPLMVGQIYNDENIKTHEQAIHKIMGHIEEIRNPSKRNIALAHGYFSKIQNEKEATLEDSGLTISDSEKRLSIGGNDLVSVQYFDVFDYTALGHLHGHQKVGSSKVKYAGSPLKYSFSEVHHKKGVLIIDMDEMGEITEKFILLKPKRDFKIVRGLLHEILQKQNEAGSICEDYIRAEIEDTEALIAPMAKLQAVFPNAMELVRVNEVERDITNHTRVQLQGKTPIELFSAFYHQVMQAKPEEEHIAWIKKAMDTAKREERAE